MENECIACGALLPESMNCKYCGMPDSWDAIHKEGNITITTHWYWGGYLTIDKYGGVVANKPYHLLSYDINVQ